MQGRSELPLLPGPPSRPAGASASGFTVPNLALSLPWLPPPLPSAGASWPLRQCLLALALSSCSASFSCLVILHGLVHADGFPKPQTRLQRQGPSPFTVPSWSSASSPKPGVTLVSGVPKAATNESVAPPPPHTSHVAGAHCSPTGRLLGTDGRAGAVLLWASRLRLAPVSVIPCVPQSPWCVRAVGLVVAVPRLNCQHDPHYFVVLLKHLPVNPLLGKSSLSFADCGAQSPFPNLALLASPARFLVEGCPCLSLALLLSRCRFLCAPGVPRPPLPALAFCPGTAAALPPSWLPCWSGACGGQLGILLVYILRAHS